MKEALSHESIQQLFTEARTHRDWLDKGVDDAVLSRIFELTKWAPTAANCMPARFLFVKSEDAKAKLLPAVDQGNVSKVKAAPVTAIIAYDEKFFEELPTLFPAFDVRSMFVSNPALSHETALRNSSLQGAYFMLAARAVGLDVGPMSGFNPAKVDEAFFKGTSWKSNFLCNIGYGDHAKMYPRGPRLAFDRACRIA